MSAFGYIYLNHDIVIGLIIDNVSLSAWGNTLTCKSINRSISIRNKKIFTKNKLYCYSSSVSMYLPTPMFPNLRLSVQPDRWFIYV